MATIGTQLFKRLDRADRSDCARADAVGRLSCWPSDRKFHAGSGTRLGQPAHRRLWNRPWAGGPHVVRYNGKQFDAEYRELLAATTGEPNCPSGGSAALADFLQNVASEAGLAGKLNECGVEQERVWRRARPLASTGRRRSPTVDRIVQPCPCHSSRTLATV